MSMPFFDSNKAPYFAGEVTSIAVKVLDKLDLFEHDDFINALPLGKLVKGTWSLISNISDPKKAARVSVGRAVGISFNAALMEFGIAGFNLQPREENQFKSDLKVAESEAEVDLSQFDVNNIHHSEVAKRFIRIYFKYFNKSLNTDPEKNQSRIEAFLNNWLTLFWRRIIEKRKDKFASLENALTSKSFQLEQFLLKRLRNQAALADMYQRHTENLDIRLSDIYIKPDCEILASTCKKERDSHVGESKFWECANANMTNDLHQLVLQWISGELDTSAIMGGNHRLLLLYGMPGQGKTSFCKRLLYDLVGGEKKTDRQVYFLRLRRVKDLNKLKSNPLETIANTLQSLFEIEVTKKELEHSILILDGMDELAMSVDLKMSEAEILLTTLLNEIRDSNTIHVIVTSRHGYVNNDRELRDALIFQIRELTRSKQLTWIRKYKQYNPTTVLNEDTFEKVEMNSPLSELITQPILLQMVANLDQIPDSASKRGAVYKLLFDQIVETPWRKKNIDALAKISDSKRAKRLFRHSLQEMAFLMFKNGKDYLLSKMIEKIRPVERLMTELGDKNARDALKTMYISFYFKEVGTDQVEGYRNEENEDYSIEFVHKSFGEFLIAEYMYRRLFEIYLCKDDYGDIALTERTSALREWNNLISQRPFSVEIVEYFIHLMKEDDREAKKHQLKERLIHFADFLFKNGFIDQSDSSNYEISPVKRGIESSYIWFTLIGNLNKEVLTLPKYGLGYLRLVLLNGRKINLPYWNLSGIYLNRADLSDANLSGANLSDANLGSADLSDANLSGANLSDANLGSADLSYANLSGANLSSADLSGSDLSSADLSGSDLSGANLSRTVVYNLNLSNAYLRDINLSRANLSCVDLNEADLRRANLSNSDLWDADLRHADLRHVDLYRANLINANLNGAYLYRTKLGEVDLTSANLKSAYLHSADLTGADLTGADLTGADLTKVDLRNTTLNKKQLETTKSLYLVKNLDPALRAELEKKIPCLFEEPTKENGYDPCNTQEQ